MPSSDPSVHYELLREHHRAAAQAAERLGKALSDKVAAEEAIKESSTELYRRQGLIYGYYREAPCDDPQGTS